MRVSRRGVSGADDVVFEAMELYFGTQGIRTLARGGVWFDGGSSGIGDSAADGGMFNVNAGTVETATIFDGQGCYSMTSAAATVNGRQSTNFCIPLGGVRSGLHLPLRYILEAEVKRVTTPIVAATGVSFGIRRFNGVFGLFANSQGVTVDSIAAVNGGRWTVFHRVGAATALQSLDTGIPGTTPALIRFDYRDTDEPELRVSVNGTVYRTLSAAEIPTLDEGFNQGFSSGFFQGDSSLAGVGQVDIVRRGRFKVLALPGFPTDA